MSDSDGDTLNIDCVHGVDVSTADWELVTSEFDGEPQPSPGPAPSVSQSLLVDTPEALTEWFADGTVLTFTSLSPQLEGIYRCGVGNMRIRLTYGKTQHNNCCFFYICVRGYCDEAIRCLHVNG